MKKPFLILLAILLALSNLAWWTPRSTTNVTASPDVLAASSDSYSVGASTDVWRNGYFSRMWFKEQAEAPAATAASFGTLFVSTDDHIYFTNDSGTSTKLD